MAKQLEITDRDALILVDVQVDFCPGGALAVAEGDRIVPVLNRLLPRFRTVVATKDWHPADHCSFQAQGGPWPPHCVQGTPGAEYHAGLELPAEVIHVRKACEADTECFDNFAGRPDLAAELTRRGIERVFVGGLATDYCVLNTVLGARQRGFEVIALLDAMRAVEVTEGDGQRALEEMRRAGAALVRAEDIDG